MPGRIRTDHIKTSKSDKCPGHAPVTNVFELGPRVGANEVEWTRGGRTYHISRNQHIPLCRNRPLRARLSNQRAHPAHLFVILVSIALFKVMLRAVEKSRIFVIYRPALKKKSKKIQDWISRVKQKQIKIPLTKVIRYKGQNKKHQPTSESPLQRPWRTSRFMCDEEDEY